MTPVELDQFLVDYHPSNDTISVNCQWLQSKLLEYNRTEINGIKSDMCPYTEAVKRYNFPKPRV